MKPLAITVAVLFTGALAAQRASYTYIDQKPPHTNPSPAYLTALDLPKIGTTFRIRVPRSHPMSWGFADYYVAFGASNPNVPWSHAGFLYSSAEIVLRSPMGSAGSTVILAFPIPNSAGLLGAGFHQQVFFHSCQLSFCFDKLSRGGAGVIGR